MVGVTAGAAKRGSTSSGNLGTRAHAFDANQPASQLTSSKRSEQQQRRIRFLKRPEGMLRICCGHIFGFVDYGAAM